MCTLKYLPHVHEPEHDRSVYIPLHVRAAMLTALQVPGVKPSQVYDTLVDQGLQPLPSLAVSHGLLVFV